MNDIKQFNSDGISITDRVLKLGADSTDEYSRVSASVAHTCIEMAQDIITKFVEISSAEQIWQVYGVRLWLELFGKEQKQ